MHLDQLIVELKKIEFPETIEIGKHFTITNVSRMIESHYSILKANGSNPKKKNIVRRPKCLHLLNAIILVYLIAKRKFLIILVKAITGIKSKRTKLRNFIRFLILIFKL